jgi:hypothetical protein
MPPKQKRKPVVMVNSPAAVKKRLAIANRKLVQARNEVNALTRQLAAVRLTQKLRWRLSKLGVSRG